MFTPSWLSGKNFYLKVEVDLGPVLCLMSPCPPSSPWSSAGSVLMTESSLWAGTGGGTWYTPGPQGSAAGSTCPSEPSTRSHERPHRVLHQNELALTPCVISASLGGPVPPSVGEALLLPIRDRLPGTVLSWAVHPDPDKRGSHTANTSSPGTVGSVRVNTVLTATL